MIVQFSKYDEDSSDDETVVGNYDTKLTYSGEIDYDIYQVLKLSESDSGEIWFADAAKKLGLTEKYVELIKTICSYGGLLDYGCSPRGAWLTEEGKKFVKDYEKEKEE
jgi:hypothetical protein